MFKKVIAVLILATLISLVLISTFENKFDETTWKVYPSKRYNMRKDIVESELLIGKTKQEVLRLLGEPEVSNLTGKDHLIYSLGEVPSFFESDENKLVVIFEDELARKVIYSED